MERVYAAHINEDRIQTVKEHLEGTAALAGEFGEAFGSGGLAYFCGMLHDIGKYSEKFQKRIYGGTIKVDHSTAGAVEANIALPPIGFLLAYCVAGHHAGLPDGGAKGDTGQEPTLNGRLRKKLEDYEKYKAEIDFEKIKPPPFLPVRPLGKGGFSIAFYIRMLYSCLVDADFLDTEKFMQGGSDRGLGESISVLDEKLNAYIKKRGEPASEINRKRAEILNRCISASGQERGLYTLTVPTGGGKTISSLAFAIKHALKNNMGRIIYVIPYNSIIEQNAAVFKEILGEENVLEHHSNISYDGSDDNYTELLQKQRLATENWDVPVAVTTTVQFFESVFSNRSSKCRKLHNIAQSVIIFDEAQMLPTKYLIPCVSAISELVYNYGCTVLLCSATQPALGRFFPKELKITEISRNIDELYGFFKRTRIIHMGALEDSELAGRLMAEKQALCIVNTRKHAQNIFKLIKTEDSFHLSTLMYPLHRKKALREIRYRLNNGLPCRVVSTSLIEAGVDLDFPVVYRAEAGLDSQIQAAGRCNREGRRSESPVYIFMPAEEYRRHMPVILKRPTEIGRIIAGNFQDISSPEAISEYFSRLYGAEGGGLDTKGIFERFEKGLERGFSFPFAQVASEFKLIDNSGYSIFIPADSSAVKLLQRLAAGERNRGLLRGAQQYMVNVYKQDYEALFGTGSIQPLDDEISVLADTDMYSGDTGLALSTENGTAIMV